MLARKNGENGNNFRVESGWNGANYADEADWSRPREEAPQASFMDEKGYSDPTNTSQERPDITVLTKAERKKLLPASATGAQYGYYWGDVDTTMRRLSVSLGLTFLAINLSSLIAVPTGLYWLWSPVALAARRNAPTRRYKFAGLWRTKVLNVQSSYLQASDIPPPSKERYFDIVFGLGGEIKPGRVLRLLVGDASGASVEVEVPYVREHRGLRVGDAAELVVVSDSPKMGRFRALREVYLPEIGVWASEYPFSERSVFKYISDAIEAERRNLQ